LIARFGRSFAASGGEILANFHNRFSAALLRRIYPNAALHLKQLAYELDIPERTLRRWWRGESELLARDLERIALYFADRDDRAFLREVFNGALFERAISADRDELIRLLRATLTAVHSENGVQREMVAWVTDLGMVVPAPYGQEVYVRQALRLPRDAGNLIRYATEMLGWVAINLEGDGTLVARHDGRHVAPLAAESLSDWLARRPEVERVVRLVQIDGELLTARHDSVELAIEALQRIAFIVRRPRQEWEVKRVSPDSVTNARLRRLLRIYHESPDQVIPAAVESGALTDSSLFAINGENVMCLFVPPRYLISQQSVEGQNIMSMPDTAYAMMARSRFLTAMQEGPVYCELTGTVNNEYLHYLNLAIPVSGTHSKLISSSVILEHEILS
jgi:transcriptional regulator with XRE-family HTH domain